MKNTIKYLFAFCFLVIGLTLSAQPPGQWVWIHGDNALNPTGHFGVKGITSPANKPPALYDACEWVDAYGNFWLFGGGQTGMTEYGALWKYEPAINQWTWMKGDSTMRTAGHYGIKGLPDPANSPPSRQYGEVSWTDMQGNLWMYGGSRNSWGQLWDLWKYDVLTNEWTWMQGDSTFSHAPVYGTQGVPDINNTPGARDQMATGWTDNVGNLWLFGGRVGNYQKNDLWKYTIATNMWTWVKGPQAANDYGSYGTLQVESSTNLPPARQGYAHWKDLSGNFWLFGGGWNGDRASNDMWRYNPATNNWTWMHGDNVYNTMGNYGSTCVTSSVYDPGCRKENRACITDEKGNLWMYGGWNEIPVCGQSNWSDLWMYCVSSNKWTLINGSNLSTYANWGSIGVPSASNQPGCRFGHNAWYDNAGHIYVFGGLGYNDLWKFTIDHVCGDACETLSAGISDKNVGTGIKVYPNPTTSILTLETAHILNKLTLYTTDGRLVKSIVNYQLSTVNLDLQGLSAGIYVLDCESEKGHERVKVVKY